MSLVSATRSTQLLNCTSAIVLELQEKTIQYSHQSRLQTGELHELLRKPMNIHHVLQTCTMITGGGGIPPLPAHAQTVDTRPYLLSSIGLGTRLPYIRNGIGDSRTWSLFTRHSRVVAPLLRDSSSRNGGTIIDQFEDFIRDRASASNSSRAPKL